MNPFLNVFRGVITSIIGTVLILASAWFFFMGGEDWVGYEWHLACSFTVGIILLIMPDKIPAFVQALADKYIFKKNDQK